MTQSKKLLIAAASVVGVLGAGATTASVLADSTSGSNNTYPPIVQKIADTFHLNVNDVQKVFDQEKQDRQQDRQAKLKAKLDQAVADGKLTKDQENKLITELQTLHDQQKADNKADRQTLRTQLEQWAKDNGINNLDQILPSPPMHHHF